jgi:WD repeat-containing protein 48
MLMVDSDRYSGGRDGVICAWDAGASHQSHTGNTSPTEEAIIDTTKKSSYKNQVQAHTHWVNDIVLVQEGSALVSASSDLSVKLWRPLAEDGGAPQTLGLHSDYVKCLAAPGHHANWVASGGLDRKICLWDLNEGSQKLQIDVGEDENSAKGSVYALAVGGGILASGGPESIVRVWDPRSGRRITKFVGHTDNIRDILISATGDIIMTASSDQTVKVWSVTAGRCMYTLTMHNESVWSLFSSHPQLSVFYSSDRSGLVAKTDVRGTMEMDDGLCLAVCQEHEGVSKVISNGSNLWTATSSSSINRWAEVDMESEVQFADYQRHHRASSTASRTRAGPLPRWVNFASSSPGVRQVSLNSILRLSNAAAFPGPQYREPDYAHSTAFEIGQRSSEVDGDLDAARIVPLHDLPEDTIEGQHGLIKHVMLNDRRRVLTLDTAGEIVMWDILKVCVDLYCFYSADVFKCVPIQAFGKRHLEDVLPEVNTTENVTNWCLVDTRAGNLACVLEDNHCFDAEMYADELQLEDSEGFKEDQRSK